MVIFKDALKNINVVLTGFMGTGKTAVGEILASKLKRTLIDTDRIVEEKTGLTVTQIFQQHGEIYFRDRESEVISGLSQYQPGSLVIATGGGVVLREGNMKVLEQNSLIILLTASPRAILRRISKTDQRPILSGPDAAEKIRSKLLERDQFYSNYSLRIDTTGRTPLQVVGEIMFSLENN